MKKSKVIEENPAEGLEKQKIRDCDVKQKPYIEAHYLRDMVDNARTIRDKAIILLFATTGLRVSELTNLTVEQYMNLGGLDGRELAIVGKGNKVRRVYIMMKLKK